MARIEKRVGMMISITLEDAIREHNNGFDVICHDGRAMIITNMNNIEEEIDNGRN